jgi:hypothetical protein
METEIDYSNLQAHPLADLLPMIRSEAEFGELVEDIRTKGLLSPIVLFQGMILDGRNRYKACSQLIEQGAFEWDPKFHIRHFHGDEVEAVAYVESLNVMRRHLSSSQRAVVAAKLATLRHGGSTTEREGAVTAAMAAKALNVSENSVKTAKKVRRTVAPAILAMVERGEITLNTAESVAELSPRRQARLVTVDAVIRAAERQRKVRGRFSGYTLPRLLDTIVEALDEAVGREGLTSAATSEIVQKLTSTLNTLQRLDDAIAEVRSATA